MFRGKISAREMDTQLASVVSKDSDRFVEWIPHNIKASICDVPPIGHKVRPIVASLKKGP